MESATRLAARLERQPLCLSLAGDFRGRPRLPKLARQALAELLVEANCDEEDRELGIIAAQELAENLVKYSNSNVSQLQVTIDQPDTQRIEIEFRTTNDASQHEIGRIQALLREAKMQPDPVAFYHQRIASSPTRERSELGLLRLLAEGMLSLQVNEIEGRICIEVRGSLRRSEGSYPSHSEPLSS